MSMLDPVLQAGGGVAFEDAGKLDRFLIVYFKQVSQLTGTSAAHTALPDDALPERRGFDFPSCEDGSKRFAQDVGYTQFAAGVYLLLSLIDEVLFCVVLVWGLAFDLDTVFRKVLDVGFEAVGLDPACEFLSFGIRVVYAGKAGRVTGLRIIFDQYPGIQVEVFDRLGSRHDEQGGEGVEPEFCHETST